jgi:hypothetical protein
MKLYQVCLKVRPSKDHPKFFEAKFGYLSIFLFGESPDDAAERAVTITEQLPYERVNNQETWQESWRVSVSLAGGSKGPEFREIEQRARDVGIGVCLHYCVMGVDEGNFEDIDPP